MRGPFSEVLNDEAERGIQVAHSTILRWVTRHMPEFEKRWNRFSKAVATSWRVDGWLQVVQERGHHDRRNRAGPPHSQKRVLVRSWTSAT
jgi:transposase-like protein